MKKLALLIAASLLLTGCVGQNPSSEPQQPPTVAPTPALPTGGQTFDLNPTDFTPNITNPNLPLKAGTRWTYREVEGSEVTTVVTVATGDTKVLANGIEARVIRDSSWVAGKIVEDTFDWYAQDRAGNVWYLGEDTSVWEDGKITSRAAVSRPGRTAP